MSVNARSPWPDAIESLGPRTVGPFDPCAVCQASSFARYGGIVLCLLCALERWAE